MEVTEARAPGYKSSAEPLADRVTVTYYTDPLCCWCWAMEASWQRLLEEYKDQISVRYVLGGMIPDWNSYHDPLNEVSRALQMGPVWMHAAQITQTKINHSIWHLDPPASSYPSSIAIKCVDLQTQEATHRYLQKVRKAVMIDGLNISKAEVLMKLAEQLEEEMPERFSLTRFKEDWKNNAGRHALRKDMEQVAFRKIGRYPTWTFVKEGAGLIMTGYRPYEELKKALKKVMSTEVALK